MISCVWTRRPFCGRREGEQIHVCCVGESTGERSWGFVAFQLLTAIMFALRQELCDVGYRHLSTTYCCYRMWLLWVGRFWVMYSFTCSLYWSSSSLLPKGKCLSSICLAWWWCFLDIYGLIWQFKRWQNFLVLVVFWQIRWLSWQAMGTTARLPCFGDWVQPILWAIIKETSPWRRLMSLQRLREGEFYHSLRQRVVWKVARYRRWWETVQKWNKWSKTDESQALTLSRQNSRLVGKIKAEGCPLVYVD